MEEKTERVTEQKPRTRQEEKGSRKNIGGNSEKSFLSAAELMAAAQGFLRGEASESSIEAAALLGNQAVLGLERLGADGDGFAESASAVLSCDGFNGFSDTAEQNSVNVSNDRLFGAETPAFIGSAPTADFGSVQLMAESYMN